MSIPQALEYIAATQDRFPSMTFGLGGNVMIQDNGSGPFIAEWPDEYGTQPTAEELATVIESEAFKTWQSEAKGKHQKRREIIAEMPAESTAEALASTIEKVDRLINALLPDAKDQAWAQIVAKAGKVNTIKERPPAKREKAKIDLTPRQNRP